MEIEIDALTSKLQAREVFPDGRLGLTSEFTMECAAGGWIRRFSKSGSAEGLWRTFQTTLHVTPMPDGRLEVRRRDEAVFGAVFKKTRIFDETASFARAE